MCVIISGTKQRVSVLSSSRERNPSMRTNHRNPAKMVLYLSGDAKENLEALRLLSLDKQGRKPKNSEIIETLINAALKKHRR